MPSKSFEIRVCLNCGLRYPLIEGQNFGARCPDCMGETENVFKGRVKREAGNDRPKMRGRKRRQAVLIDNIRSAWNIGSILRSTDGFGADHVFLCGISPTPENEAVQKTSLGAEDFITWSYHKDAVKLVKDLKKENWTILSLEDDRRAIPIDQYRDAPQNTLLIVGSEVTGVDPGLLALCDQILVIPMHGGKRSFNAANAFSIAAYAIFNHTY